jgi:2-iminobutanoate/2-iminopropanoate deaminase
MPTLETIISENAPAPIGPYSQAIRAGGFLFCSGQIPLDPKTGDLKNSSIEEEVGQVLANISAVLAAAGLTFEHVVKTTIFLTSINDFPVVNSIYESKLAPSRPARSTVEVSKLPKGARVEIECIAMCD